MLIRRPFVKSFADVLAVCWCLLFLLGTGSTSRSFGAEHPNVIVILTDDQGWGDFGIHGNTNLQTPHVDSLAKEGAQFERFYVCAVCSPTRAEFLTGRYHPRGGVYGVSTGGERLDADETTIADHFRKAGYATAAFGKWHNGTQYPYHPNARGFEEFYGFCSGHWGNYFSPMLDHNNTIVTGEGYATDDFTNRAIEFIQQQRDQPFFVYLALNIPHSPMQVPDRFWDKFADKKLELRGTLPDRENVDHTRAALAMCENIDWNVGRLLAALDEQEIAENTIVAYFCDNGPNGHRWNGEMKGIKGSVDEGGLRSPLFVRWKGRIEAETRIDPIAGAIDLLPTLAELAGVDVAAKKPLDGRSFAAALRGEAHPAPPRVLYSHWGGRVSARSERYRYDHEGQLFDMQNDPGQTTDVGSQLQKTADEFETKTAQWKATVLAELGRTPKPFDVGYGGVQLTQLPARDGKSTGGITRSSRHPNCSFFQNWASVDDRIAWDVHVHTPGEYEIEVYYTCAPENVGSTIELSLGDSSVTATVADANDPPLRGAEQDRVQRTESYVKDFKPLQLGTIQLAEGDGALTLRALEIPGNEVMDVRLLTLRLVGAGQ